MSKGPGASSAAPGPVAAHRFLLALLHSPFGRLFGGLSELRFVGRVSGRTISLPVQCAREGTQLVIYVGDASAKSWWRNFIDGLSVQMRVAGVPYRGHGRVVDIGHPDRAWAERTYHRRYPRVELLPIDPMVVIDVAAGTAEEMVHDRVRGQ
jgi:hypothetical protein